MHVTYRPISRADVEAGRGSVIGEPIPDLAIYLLDRYGDPAPIGERVAMAGLAESTDQDVVTGLQEDDPGLDPPTFERTAHSSKSE